MCGVVFWLFFSLPLFFFFFPVEKAFSVEKLITGNGTQRNVRRTNLAPFEISPSEGRISNLDRAPGNSSSPASGARSNSLTASSAPFSQHCRNPRRAGYLTPLTNTDNDQKIKIARNKWQHKDSPEETAVSFLTIFIYLIIHIKTVLTKSRSGWGCEQSLGLGRLFRTWHSGSGSFLHPIRVDTVSLQN